MINKCIDVYLSLSIYIYIYIYSRIPRLGPAGVNSCGRDACLPCAVSCYIFYLFFSEQRTQRIVSVSWPNFLYISPLALVCCQLLHAYVCLFVCLLVYCFSVYVLSVVFLLLLCLFTPAGETLAGTKRASKRTWTNGRTGCSQHLSCLRSPWGDFLFKWNALNNNMFVAFRYSVFS